MKYLFHLLVFAAISSFAFSSNAATLRIVHPMLAMQASYTSSDLTESLAYWIIDGQVVERAQARDLIFNHGKTACTVWLMNFSDDETIEKSTLQNSILTVNALIPLWKVINGRPIFVDDTTSFAISYNCVVKNSDGEFSEVEFLTTEEFNNMFKTILKIEP